MDTIIPHEEFEKFYEYHSEDTLFSESNKLEWVDNKGVNFGYITLNDEWTMYLNANEDDLKKEGMYYMEYRSSEHTAQNIPFIESYFSDVFNSTQEERLLFTFETQLEYPL